MKIVQSLWSKPAQASGGWERHTGHWPSPHFFWCSWVLSTQWAFKHYGNVELVTDDEGARWLVDRLKLPFTSVRTDLHSLDVPESLWAFGKIAAYALQKEPFFHIDGDVYLMGKLPQKYETVDLLCQFFEQYPAYPNFEYFYDKNRAAIEKSSSWLPGFWKFMNERSAANCGIMGGANIDAIQKYASDVRGLVLHPQNRAIWTDASLNLYVNCVIEQQALWCSAREQGVTLTPLFENTDFSDVDSFRRKALATNFNHAASIAKNRSFGTHLKERVQAEYPEQYRIIEGIFSSNTSEL
ncbi:MAG: DUF6734 family protein [Tepidisphaeraceae bacterium]